MPRERAIYSDDECVSSAHSFSGFLDILLRAGCLTGHTIHSSVEHHKSRALKGYGNLPCRREGGSKRRVNIYVHYRLPQPLSPSMYKYLSFGRIAISIEGFNIKCRPMLASGKAHVEYSFSSVVVNSILIRLPSDRLSSEMNEGYNTLSNFQRVLQSPDEAPSIKGGTKLSSTLNAFFRHVQHVSLLSSACNSN